jgi:hypothetical protein
MMHSESLVDLGMKAVPREGKKDSKNNLRQRK